MIKASFWRVLACALFFTALPARLMAQAVPETCYLFAYFTDETGGLRLAWSEDGLAFHPLNNGQSYLVPSVGENKLMRDPSIVLGPDNVFRLVWTTGWTGTTIGYSSSTDLKTWTPQVAIPLWNGHPDQAKVTFTWAPEITYDPANSRYLIVWASNITDKYVLTAGDTYNPRMYASTTSDFANFTSPRLFFEPGIDCIDGTFFQADGLSRMCFKAETPRSLYLASSPVLDGAYNNVSPALTSPGFTPVGRAAEGPTVARVGTKWVVYYDVYTSGYYAASRSSDLVNWEDITSQISFPAGARHGTIIQVPGSVITALRPSQAPAAPANFSATAGFTEARLSWTAPTEASSYRLWRAAQNGGPFTLAASGLTSTTASDAIPSGSSFFYAVSAVNEIGESPLSRTVSASALPAAPLARYLFDETSGTSAVDATGLNAAGTLVNSPLRVTGKSGRAVDLDGANDYVSLPSGLVASLRSFTISTWVNLDANTQWSRIFDFGTGTSSYLFLTPRSSAGKVRFGITSPNNGGEQQIDGTAPLPLATWVHVAISYAGQLGILYVNGVEVGRNNAMTLSPQDLGTTTQNWLGRSQFTSDPYLNGRIDDFRLFKGALSAREIATMVTAPTPPTGLARTDLSESQIRLNWTAPSAPGTGYTLARAPGSTSSWTTLSSTIPAEATSFQDNGLTASTGYTYRLQANGLDGPSAPATLTITTTSGVGDGIPGWWRYLYFGNGLSATGNAALTADPDGDGWNNQREYLAGTDPTNSASRFTISSVTLTGGNAVITFPSVLGKTYRVEQTSNLTSGPWTTVSSASDISGTGNILSFTLPAPASPGFFRILTD